MAIYCEWPNDSRQAAVELRVVHCMFVAFHQSSVRMAG